jgi:hypothetical protein
MPASILAVDLDQSCFAPDWYAFLARASDIRSAAMTYRGIAITGSSGAAEDGHYIAARAQAGPTVYTRIAPAVTARLKGIIASVTSACAKPL